MLAHRAAAVIYVAVALALAQPAESVGAKAGFWWRSKSQGESTPPPSLRQVDAKTAAESEDAVVDLSALDIEDKDREDSQAETLAHRIGDSADNDDYLGAFPGQ
eukprot:gb/GFBE01019569.1/.p1 GENE.gb/GFBE01019569.1/~~gb/GFBE01019569.1/.p1  ORF type:complete len:104 (+),score=27.81 gb/GFBE01019569.1/:1-312(+)